MTTRSGTPYQVPQDQPSTSMDPTMETFMRSLTEQMRQLSAEQRQFSARVDQRFDQMNERIGSLEGSHVSQPDPTPLEFTPQYGPGPQLPELTHDPIPRHQAQRREATPDPIPRHRAQRREVTPDPIPRRQQYDIDDQEARALRSIRLEAPTFDGTLDPKMYSD